MTSPAVFPSSVFEPTNANISSDSSHIIALFLIFVDEPSPRVKTIPKSFAGDSVNPWPNLIKVSAIVVFVESTVVLVPPIDKFPAIVTLAPLVVIAVVPSLALIILPPNFKLDANSTSVLALGSVIDEFPALFLIVLSPLVPNCTAVSYTHLTLPTSDLV